VRPELRKLAIHPKVVALGETGMDFHYLPSQKEGFQMVSDEDYKQRQRRLFEQHLEVAADVGLNVVVHQRDAFEDTLAILEPFAKRGVRGVFHCFVGDQACMDRILTIGSLVSFTGIVTFKNAEEVRATLRSIPMNKFMLETDCPYLAPIPFRGKRCEPAHVSNIAEKVAEVKNCSLEDLSGATCATARDFFKKLN
jgi:TatD DNase family protein